MSVIQKGKNMKNYDILTEFFTGDSLCITHIPKNSTELLVEYSRSRNPAELFSLLEKLIEYLYDNADTYATAMEVGKTVVYGGCDTFKQLITKSLEECSDINVEVLCIGIEEATDKEKRFSFSTNTSYDRLLSMVLSLAEKTAQSIRNDLQENDPCLLQRWKKTQKD